MTVPSSGPMDARILIVGEAPGVDEVRLGQPFVGMSGQLLDRMLADAGIARGQCRVTNVCRERPPGNKIEAWVPKTKKAQDEGRASGWPTVGGRVVHPHIAGGHALLMAELEAVRPTLILALGNTALWALTGLDSVAKWRGSTLETPYGLVLPTYHPASVLRQWTSKPIVVQDLRRAASSLQRYPHHPRWEFTIRPGMSKVRSTLDRLYNEAEAGPLKLSVDIETRAGHIACLGIAWSDHEAICIPFLCVERPDGYWAEDEEAEIVWLLYRLLTHNNVLSIGQNFIYDSQYILRHWHFVARSVRDTMVAQHVCFPGMPKSLDHIASMYCDYYVYWKDDGKEWDKGADQDEDKYWAYNCEDCIRTYEADTVLQNVVDRMGLRAPHDFQQSLFGPVLRTMARGVRVDNERRQAMLKELKDHARQLEAEITEMVGYPLNPKSPKQMQAFFYDEMGCAAIRNRKTKSLSCDDEALEKIAQRESIVRPIVDRIKEYRSCETLASNALKASAIGFDGRIHCSYNITGTITFRFSSSTDAFGSGMNLQNITAGDEE
jgi:uracil-DNA glycosylase